MNERRWRGWSGARGALAVLTLPLAGQGCAGARAPVATVAAVDLGRYQGSWYEIASLPMFFQRNCIADTTATYAALPGGKVSVTNRCRTTTGVAEVHGTATAVAGTGNARLRVSFFWPFAADYWVIGLDPDFRWAVVGNPARKYLWVLSRTPALPADLLDLALRSARAQGYDLAALHYTAQSPPR